MCLQLVKIGIVFNDVYIVHCHSDANVYIYKSKFSNVVVISGQFAGLCFPTHEPN